MASIGEIISTPLGLATVTYVLPTQLRNGSQTLTQVVAEPLTGGPPNYVPPPAIGIGVDLLMPSVQAQAAASYVASVVNPKPPSTGVPGAIEPANAPVIPPIPGAIPASVYQSASKAYQATVDALTPATPSITMMG